jgi:plastocyanin
MSVRSSFVTVAVVVGTLFVFGCSQMGQTSSPTVPSSVSAIGSSGNVALPPSQSAGPIQTLRGTRQVSMMDACDGPTFNLVIGPGTCNRNGGVNFSEFVAQLTAHQAAGAWHNAPSQTESWLGDALVAVNNGGETHTFTRVANFGGGIVPFLNNLAGTPNVVTECAHETVFVQPGGSDTESLDQPGELKFQCCIHPWMRTTVLVKSH